MGTIRRGRQPSANVLAGRRPVSRRRFLELAGAAGAAALVAPLLDGVAGGTPAPLRPAAAPPLPPGYVPSWPDGVIAGDPHADGSVIWARLGAPANPAAQLDLLWEVAEDAAFAVIAAGGTTSTTATDDFCAKVAVTGLQPDRWYWYRFTAGAATSPVGRLRTAPTAAASPDRLRYAWCSCQQRNDSLYVAHTAMRNEPDLDFFMHLGDYVYVSDTNTLTLDDYRGVYHTFKANSRLQDLQANVPLVAIIDDGEFYNGVDAYGPPARLAAGRKAWVETMPLSTPPGDPFRFYRSFPWGDLAEVFMIDTRSYRDPAIEAGNDTRTPEGAPMLDPSRTTLGASQKAWLKQGLAASSRLWKLLGNSYNMSPVRVQDLDPGPPRPPGVQQNEGVYYPNEAWDDYNAERREILQHIADQGVRNVVSTSGHTHVFIASLLIPDFDDPASPLAAFDFTCGSLTADPDVIKQGAPAPPEAVRAQFRGVEQLGININPWLAHLNLIDQGYGLIEVTPEEATIEFKLIDTYDPNAEAVVGVRFVIRQAAHTFSVQGFEHAPFGPLTYRTPPYAEPEPPPPPSTTPATSTPSSTTPGSGGGSSTTSAGRGSAAAPSGAATPVTASPRFTG